MSLLLDALKKAALEKQRREQPASAQPASAQPAGEQTTREQAIREQVTREKFASEQPPHEKPEPANQHSIEVSPTPLLSSQPVVVDDILPVPNVAMDTYEEDFTPTGAVVEIAVDGAPEPLVFDIDEIDHDYLGVPLELTVAPTPISITAAEPKIKEVKIQEPTPKVLEVVEVQKARAQESSIQETSVQKPRVQQPDHPIPESKAPLISPEPEPAVSEAQRSESTESEVSSVAQFSATAGKAALSQLMARSKKATDNARKRILIMYALLTLTAITVLVFYYYLLQSSSVAVVVPEPKHVSASSPDAAPAAALSGDAVVPTDVAAPPADAINVEKMQPETSVQEGKLAAPVVRSASTPSIAEKSISEKSNAEQFPSEQSYSALRAKQLARRQVVAPVSSGDSTRSSNVVPPEFVTKQGIIVAHQKPGEDALSEAIDRGYSAYQRGELEVAKAAYREALQEDPNQRDALLGAAAVAVREGRQQDALGFYQQRLARAPKDDYAQAGILALSVNSEQNPQFESELTQLLREYPNAAHLHFLQGSLYAARQQWDAAQLAFFEAWQRDTKNPDLAFNLAVALDHLNQPKEAVRFYQQALALSNAHSITFSKEAIERRIKELEPLLLVNQKGNSRQEESKP